MASNFNQPQSWYTQLQSFFTVQFQRVVNRARGNNPDGSNNMGTAMTSTPPKSDQSGYIGGGTIPIGNITVYPDHNSEGYVRDVYSGNATLYTIISTISRRFAYIPRYVYKVKNSTAVREYKHYVKMIDPALKGHKKTIRELHKKAYEETIPDNALSALLMNPNPKMGQDFFFQLACTHYKTQGEAIIWLNRGSDADDIPYIDGPILEMWLLPPQYMEIIPDPYNVWGSLGWIFNVSGKRIPVDDENIIHWRTPNPNFNAVTREHMRGLSPLRPGKKKLTEDESATDASVSMHQNNGARAVVFDKNLGSKMTATQETAIRGVIDRRVNNTDMKGAVAYVQGDLGSIDLSMSSVDQELEKAKDNIFDRLCNLYQVNPNLFRAGGTYENVVQARKDLVSSVTLPDCCTLRDEMNKKLLPAFNLNSSVYTTDIDANQIPELQDDLGKMVDSLSKAWWMTPNEKRAEMNLEPSEEEGADQIFIPTTYQLMEDAVTPSTSSFDNNLNFNENDNLSGSDQGNGGKENTDKLSSRAA